jgi:hypothetical protein
MKPLVTVISAFLILSFSVSAVLAYEGSECEVNDCSKPSTANSKPTKGQAKAKTDNGAATKTKPATVKDQAKGLVKDKVIEKVPSQFQGLTDLLK